MNVTKFQSTRRGLMQIAINIKIRNANFKLHASTIQRIKGEKGEKSSFEMK